MSDKDLRDKVIARWTQLKLEREPYIAQWRAISELITPASGRFLGTQDNNRGRDRWNRIYDNTATRAANILAAGLMSGMTDPSSQWFALTTGDPSLDESQAVKTWLDQVQRILEMAFTRTNVYQALHHGWREVGTMGVLANVIVEDPHVGFYCHPLVIGEYCIAVDYAGRPDTLYRNFKMTASQLYRRYGRSRLPRTVLDCLDKNQDRKFRCLHAIEPRLDRDYTKQDNLNMPWRSVVILMDGGDETSCVLEESGYNEFPAVVGRWGASASDVYSEEAPGMVAIGDVRQLQHQALQKGNAIDYQVNPPLILPANAKDQETDFLPGGISYIAGANANDVVQSAYNVQTRLADLTADMRDVQMRINQAFNVDMFLMLSGGTGRMTATEVAERHEEKLMMLGPVLSRLNNEVLRPLIERTYSILQRAGQIPPAPEELRGQSIAIEYTSMLARSQRAIRANSLSQFLNVVAQVAQFKPEVLEKVNGFNVINEYADYYSVAPSVVVPDDEAIQSVQAQQQAQQAQAQQAQMAEAGDTIAKLGRVPAGNDTVGGQVAQGLVEAMQQGAM